MIVLIARAESAFGSVLSQHLLILLGSPIISQIERSSAINLQRMRHR